MESGAALSPLILAALGWVSLAALAVSAVRHSAGRSPVIKSDGWWWSLAGVTLLAFRWPLLWVPHQFNPDESQLIAGALTLRHDPMFWRAVDGGTAGPLDYYPLLPAAWGDGPASYAIARLIALATVFGALIFAGASLRRAIGAEVARLAVLPALVFVAFTTHPDFTHYSTELMPLLLLAAAVYLAIRHAPAPSPWLGWAVALLLGSVLWAKPQAVPLAATVWGLFVANELRCARAKNIFLSLVVGSLLPTLVCFVAVTAAGQTEHLIVPYFLRNFGYVREAPLPFVERALLQWQNSLVDGYLGLWLAGTLLLAAVGLAGARGTTAPLRRLALAEAVVLAVGGLTAIAPSRPSAHHLWFIVLPLVWTAGIALAVMNQIAADAPAQARRRLLVAGLFLAGGTLPQLGWRARHADEFAYAHTLGIPAARLQLSTLIRRLTLPDEPLAVWGWRTSLYVEAGRRQATRQAQTEAQIYPNDYQRYFLRRYFEDFQAAQPPVFADAVGPGNFAFVDPRQAHESFPPLREWVRARYTLIATIDGVRLFVRNDRLDRLSASP